MSSRPIRTENEGRLFELFKTAVQDERKAQRVYAQALSLCADPSLRMVLQGLIDDEARHEQILIERYNALASGDLAGLEMRRHTQEHPASDGLRE
jgi:rubrerythrin